MSANGPVNDGGLGYACRKIDVYIPDSPTGGSGVQTTYTTKRGTYLLNSFSPRRPFAVANRVSEIGQPNGAVMQPALVTGSGDVQLPGDPSINQSVKQIYPGDAFCVVLDQGGTPETFLITEVSSPEESNSIKKQTVSFQKASGGTSCPVTA